MAGAQVTHLRNSYPTLATLLFPLLPRLPSRSLNRQPIPTPTTQSGQPEPRSEHQVTCLRDSPSRNLATRGIGRRDSQSIKPNNRLTNNKRLITFLDRKSVV